MERICTTCNNLKPLSEFHKCKKCKFGYKPTCKQCVKTVSNERYVKQKKTINKQCKEWRNKNKTKMREYQKIYMRNKRKDEIFFKLKTNIANSIRISFKSIKQRKNTRTTKILGCTINELKQHLESQWADWMTWDNYGNPSDGLIEPNKTWDIDHIIPISNANNEKELFELNHYTNLQPLCSYENRYIKRNT